MNGVVIRPPIMYGLSGTFVAYYIFDHALKASREEEKVFDVFMRDDTRWQTLHADDLADLYVRGCRAGKYFYSNNTANQRGPSAQDKCFSLPIHSRRE